MAYRFATEPTDYSDYAAGRVFYGLPGHTAFPVRLTSEIFQRCLAARRRAGLEGRCVVYDPCCGGAYHLATLGYLHWDAIDAIVGSDLDADALGLAARNLGLLTPDGLSQRIGEIETMLAAYGKPSHTEALESAHAFQARLTALSKHHCIHTHLFRADALDGAQLSAGLDGKAIDIVLTDVPYGRHSIWQAGTPDQDPVTRMLGALLEVTSSHTVVAIAADKGQRVAHDAFRRVERFQVGKRQVVLLRRQE